MIRSGRSHGIPSRDDADVCPRSLEPGRAGVAPCQRAGRIRDGDGVRPRDASVSRLLDRSEYGGALAHACDGGTATAAGQEVALSANRYPGAIFPDGLAVLTFVEVGVHEVSWHYEAGTIAVEKRLQMAEGTNAARLTYTNVGTTAVELTLRPLVAMRDHHSELTASPTFPEKLDMEPDALVIQKGVALRLEHPGAMRTPVQGWYYRFEYSRERERGRPDLEDLYCPCELQVTLAPGEAFSLIATDGESFNGEWPEEPVASSLRDRLTVAAERHLVTGGGRPGIIAGYPWFSDWGRDTMISLPGLCLATGKVELAREVLSSYGAAMHRGLVPNRFTEDGGTDLNTVDATLWFANAIYQTLKAEWEETFARRMLVLLEASVDWHVRGTLYGIVMDPEDGLLQQGEKGVQLTWMDAKIDDWVVTPRHGKPVEIAALWINMLHVVRWIRERLGETLRAKDDPYLDILGRAEKSFEECFWHEVRGHYLDTADPDDASLRPNQVIAMAVPFSPCDPAHARAALKVVTEKLATPFGLRSLGPNEPGYRGRYRGTLRELDSAYHQGTVWPWLIGPYATACKRFGDPKEAQALLGNVVTMLTDGGVEGIAECYDGDAPQVGNGCPFQAWSLAAFLEHLT
ncbi:MAG: glycogen debranching protein [Armatimonadota bacterium]